MSVFSAARVAAALETAGIKLGRVVIAREEPVEASPDFLVAELAGGRAFTDYVMDLGLIAVSADEVGVFWSFNAN